MQVLYSDALLDVYILLRGEATAAASALATPLGFRVETQQAGTRMYTYMHARARTYDMYARA